MPVTKSSKNIYIAIALIISLLLVGGLIFWFTGKKSETKTTQITSQKFTLVKEEGQVEFRNSGDYKKLETSEIELESETFIKTIEGQANVFLKDNSMISIDKNTEIQIILDTTSTQIIQLAGNTWHRIKKLGSNENYQVETPTALATVRGTKFGVETSKEKSDIFVTENVVEVGQLDTSSGEKVWKNKQNLGANKLASVENIKTRDGFETVEIPEQRKNLKWFLKNQAIDKDYENEKNIERSNFIQKLNTSAQRASTIKEPPVRTERLPINNPNPTFQNSIESALGQYTQIQGDGSETCAGFEEIDVDEFIAQLSLIEASYGTGQFDASQFRQFFLGIKSACSDGRISPQEIESISGLTPKPN